MTGIDRELSDANVIPETVHELLRPANNQLAGDAQVVERLSVDFDAEVVAGSFLPNPHVLTRLPNCMVNVLESFCERQRFVRTSKPANWRFPP